MRSKAPVIANPPPSSAAIRRRKRMNFLGSSHAPSVHPDTVKMDSIGGIAVDRMLYVANANFRSSEAKIPVLASVARTPVIASAAKQSDQKVALTLFRLLRYARNDGAGLAGAYKIASLRSQ